MSKLLGCPFCGGESELVSEQTYAHYVRCMCCSQQFMHSTATDAITAWNTRSEPVGVPTVQAGMEKPLDGWSITMQEGGNIFVESPSGDYAHVFMDDISPLAEVTRQLLQTLAFGRCAMTDIKTVLTDEDIAGIHYIETECREHPSPLGFARAIESAVLAASAGKVDAGEILKIIYRNAGGFNQTQNPYLTQFNDEELRKLADDILDITSTKKYTSDGSMSATQAVQGVIDLYPSADKQALQCLAELMGKPR